MAQQAKTQLEIAVKATGVAGLSKLKSALGSVDKIAKQSAVNFKGIGKELQQKNKTMVRSVENVSKLKASYQELARSVEFGSRQFKVATERAKKLDKELAKMEGRKPPGGGMGRVAQAFGAVVGLGTAQQALQTGIQREESERRLQFLAKGYGEVAQLQLAAASASRKFGQSQTEANQALANIYARLRPIGASLEDITSVYNGFNTAARVSGANAQEAANAFTQLAQGLGSGALRGDEFNSIAEQVPSVLTAISQETGVAQGKLRDFAAEGGITTEVVLNALRRIEQEGAEQLSEALNGPAQKVKNLQNTFEDLQVAVTKAVVPEIAKSLELVTKALKEILPVVDVVAGGFARLFRLVRLQAESAASAIKNLSRGDFGALFEFTPGKYEELFAGNGPKKVRYPTAAETQAQAALRNAVTDAGTTGSEAKKIKDISDRMFEARKAALEYETEKERLKLEFAVRRLRIEESQKGKKEKIIELLELEKQLSDGLAKIDKQRADELERLFKSFKVKPGQFNMMAQVDKKTPFDAFSEGAKEFTKSLKGALGAAKELATVGLQGISDGITNLVVNGTLNFREFAASLLRDMARIIMQQIVMKSLMQALGFGGGLDLGSFFAKSTPSFNMNQATGGLGGFGMPRMMANGGITRGVSIAGEAGPEAVVPLPDGRSIPVRMQGEGTKVVVNVDASGTAAQGDTGRARQLGDAIGSAVRQELLKQKRPGGLLA